MNRIISNHYFKDDGSRPARQYMSGLPIPLHDDGVCRNITFHACEFHPVCSDVKFENCIFILCHPHGPIANYTNCQFIEAGLQLTT